MNAQFCKYIFITTDMESNINNYASCLICFVLYFLIFGSHKEKILFKFSFIWEPCGCWILWSWWLVIYTGGFKIPYIWLCSFIFLSLFLFLLYWSGWLSIKYLILYQLIRLIVNKVSSFVLCTTKRFIT